MMRAVMVVIAALLLAACGSRQPLRPATGMESPPKPALAERAPTVDELLTPSPEARPGREDELLRRSEPRAEDPFDLPPPG